MSPSPEKKTPLPPGAENRYGRPRRLLTALLCLVVVAGLTAMPLLGPADGQERSSLAIFFGRLHPLFLHFPIALLAVVPLMEACALFHRWRHLRASVGFILWLTVAGSLAATVLGWLLAWAGGYSGELVNDHMLGGCLLSLAVLLAALLRRQLVRRGPGSVGILYPVVLLASLGLLVWTAHQGGQLTHGERYLEEHMPNPLRRWLGLPERERKPARAPAAGAAEASVPGAAPAPAALAVSFFDERIMPAFDRTCVSCHNPNKTKGGLRMDAYEHLLVGGDSGPSIVAGDAANSELYRRITLPHDDEEFMPTDGKKPLTAEETEWIKQWINAGASPDAPLSALPGVTVLAAPKSEAPAEEAIGAVPDYQPHLEAVRAWERTWGLRLVPVSQSGTDGLILRTASSPSRCTDDAIAALGALGSLIVDAELARSAVTDRALAEIAAWPHLRRLDLTQTAVTSRGVESLQKATGLRALNLTATAVEESALAPLRARAGLTVYAAPELGTK
jgi:uncharacterized membrane protein